MRNVLYSCRIKISVIAVVSPGKQTFRTGHDRSKLPRAVMRGFARGVVRGGYPVSGVTDTSYACNSSVEQAGSIRSWTKTPLYSFRRGTAFRGPRSARVPEHCVTQERQHSMTGVSVSSVNRCINQCMDQWIMNWSMDRWINESMDQWINGSTNQWIYEH